MKCVSGVFHLGGLLDDGKELRSGHERPSVSETQILMQEYSSFEITTGYKVLFLSGAEPQIAAARERHHLG
jgi:hypothetical protein